MVAVLANRGYQHADDAMTDNLPVMVKLSKSLNGASTGADVHSRFVKTGTFRKRLPEILPLPSFLVPRKGRRHGFFSGT